jgi:hypothetical protein
MCKAFAGENYREMPPLVPDHLKVLTLQEPGWEGKIGVPIYAGRAVET